MREKACRPLCGAFTVDKDLEKYKCSCVENAEFVSGSTSKCQCKSGYVGNEKETQCIHEQCAEYNEKCESSGGTLSCSYREDSSGSELRFDCQCPAENGLTSLNANACICDALNRYYGTAPNCVRSKLTCGAFTTEKGQPKHTYIWIIQNRHFIYSNI